MLVTYLPYLVILLVAVLFVWLLLSQRSRISALELALQTTEEKTQESQEQLRESIAQHATHTSNLAFELEEIREGNIGIGKKLKTIDLELLDIKTKQTSLEELDPTTKLYNKAMKIVANGGSIDDLVSECELPRAEAELLLNLHKSA